MIQTRKNLIAALLAIAALAVAIFGVRLCIRAAGAEPYVEDAAGGPTETLESFFACLEAKDWDGAYVYLYNYSSLGLETPPEDELSALFWYAQQDAWDFEAPEGYKMNGTRLEKRVRVQCLDLNAISAAIGAEVQELLTERAENAALPSQIYDENGEYREDAASDALRAAAEDVLRDTVPYRYAQELTLGLYNVDGRWLIEADAAFISALTSGAVRR